jgi:hypothetical protein
MKQQEDEGDEIWEKHVVRIGKMRNMYKIVIRKPRRNRPLGRSRRRWKNIIMYLRKTGPEM